MKSPPPLLENEKDPKSEPLSLSFYNKSAFWDILFHVGRCSGLKGWVRGYGKNVNTSAHSFIFVAFAGSAFHQKVYFTSHQDNYKSSKSTHRGSRDVSTPLSLFMGVGCVCV